MDLTAQDGPGGPRPDRRGPSSGPHAREGLSMEGKTTPVAPSAERGKTV